MKRDAVFLGVIIIIVAILLFAVSIPTVLDEFVDDYGTDYGAVFVLNFEEGTGTTTFDQSPYGNDGQFSGAPSAPTWASGKFGEALDFSSSYVTVGNVTTSLRTIEFWVKLSTTSEPILELNQTTYINATGGTLSATGFVGTTTFYVDGEVSTTVSANIWHHVALTSDTGENCTVLNLGKVGSDYLSGKLDQLRGYSVEKTLGEIRNHYLNSGHMYSGSVMVADRLLILNTTLDPQLTLEDGHLNVTGTGEFGGDVDMNHNYELYMDMDEHIHHDAVAGIGYQVIDQISAGYLTQDRHIHSVHIFVSPAPGAGKWINITLSDGTNNIWVNVTGADQEGFSDTGEFDWDVSAETFTAGYVQTAGGAVDEFCIHYDWHYKETP